MDPKTGLFTREEDNSSQDAEWVSCISVIFEGVSLVMINSDVYEREHLGEDVNISISLIEKPAWFTLKTLKVTSKRVY